MEDEREERRMAVREDMGMALVQSFSAQGIIAPSWNRWLLSWVCASG